MEELKTKRLEIDTLKILKVKRDDKLDELRKYNSKIISDHEKITIPDRLVKLVYDQDIQAHPGKVLSNTFKQINTVVLFSE